MIFIRLYSSEWFGDIAIFGVHLAEIEEEQKRALARLKELINHPQGEPLVVNVTESTAKAPQNLKPLLDLGDQCQPVLLARMWDTPSATPRA